jgi:hypothetical protein
MRYQTICVYFFMDVESKLYNIADANLQILINTVKIF